MTITPRERDLWFFAFKNASKLLAARSPSDDVGAAWVQNYAMEKACSYVLSMRRAAVGRETISDGRVAMYEEERAGAPETTHDAKCARWESEWRAMAAEMLMPEVGS